MSNLNPSESQINSSTNEHPDGISGGLRTGVYKLEIDDLTCVIDAFHDAVASSHKLCRAFLFLDAESDIQYA